jgi:anti-sigma regulatory factor (Ser/Thr protein kinase)
LTPESARVTIQDSGPGFDVSAIPDARDAERIALPSGRGILLMRSFMDVVNYNETGNRVTLVKFRSSNPEPRASQKPADMQVPVASPGT